MRCQRPSMTQWFEWERESFGCFYIECPSHRRGNEVKWGEEGATMTVIRINSTQQLWCVLGNVGAFFLVLWWNGGAFVVCFLFCWKRSVVVVRFLGLLQQSTFLEHVQQSIMVQNQQPKSSQHCYSTICLNMITYGYIRQRRCWLITFQYTMCSSPLCKLLEYVNICGASIIIGRRRLELWLSVV